VRLCYTEDMRWRSAISTAREIDAAIAEVSSGLRGDEGGPDLAFLFASAAHAEEDLAARVQRALGARRLVGCTGGGIIGDGREVEDRPAIAVAAGWLPGAALELLHLESSALPSRTADAAAWLEVVGLDPSSSPDFVVLGDPFTFDAESLVRGLDLAFPAGRKVGGLASGGMPPTGNSLFLDDRRLSSGAVALAISGSVGLESVVAQGCRPIGEPMFATRVQQNLLYAVDGKPALEALRKVYESLSSEDRALFRHSLFVGIAMHEERTEYRAGDFLVRNLVGADASSGAIAVAAPLHEGLVVQFHLRDARASAGDLEAHLEALRQRCGEEKPQGALLFSCLGRGAGLYGRPDHDSELVRRMLGAIPLAGFFCNGEIGPVGERTFLHGYTSALALFRER
jgi:small ligand-binding sensory domain FIST